MFANWKGGSISLTRFHVELKLKVSDSVHFHLHVSNTSIDGTDCCVIRGQIGSNVWSFSFQRPLSTMLDTVQEYSACGKSVRKCIRGSLDPEVQTSNIREVYHFPTY